MHQPAFVRVLQEQQHVLGIAVRRLGLPRTGVVIEPADAERLQKRLRVSGSETEVMCGTSALETVAALPEVSTVMAAIVGIAGLRATLAAAHAGQADRC